MHLRSGAYYRSGLPVRIDARSVASTQESTARAPTQGTPLANEPIYESDSDLSMASTSTNPFTDYGVELEYDVRLRFLNENSHGAKIYGDHMGQVSVKIEDHVTDFNPTPWVNFQGDRFMGRD